MQRHALRVRICCFVAILAVTGLTGCTGRVNPAGPSLPSGAGTSPGTVAAPVTGSPALAPLRAASEREDSIAQISAAHLTPADVTNRGWSCFQPLPDRIVCSHPNQGFPTVGFPPPDDRPASFTFAVFDASGRFVGTEVLLRTDLYNGQRCESTGQTYDFVSVIGFYECVHTRGR